MSVEANKAVVTRYWEDFWNQKQGDLISEITTEDLQLHFPPGQAHQPPSLKRWFETAQSAFPDVHFTMHDLIAEGDKVVCRWSYVATNTGGFLGNEATNLKVTDQGINMFRVENGKIAELWMSGDSLGLLHQLGVLPS
jgi:predicted ester cyclase